MINNHELKQTPHYYESAQGVDKSFIVRQLCGEIVAHRLQVNYAARLSQRK